VPALTAPARDAIDVLRRFYMPALFPDGGLSQQQWASLLSVRLRFYIFYFAICVFPAVMLYSIARGAIVLLGQAAGWCCSRERMRGGRAPIAGQPLVSGLAKVLNNSYILFNTGGCHGCADPHADRDR
jgi:hypothetical protein